MELLKNYKIKNSICLLGPYIYDDNNNINLFQEKKEEIIKKLCEKHQIKEKEINVQKLFKEEPNLLYEFLSHFNISIEKNKIHRFIKLLVDLDIVKFILTDNIDCLENKAEIPSEKVIHVVGKLYESNCIKCKELIDYNELIECIKSGKIQNCKKCNEIYKPNILFY
jgi:NAD-dependent SIR2 family protein deacetylase